MRVHEVGSPFVSPLQVCPVRGLQAVQAAELHTLEEAAVQQGQLGQQGRRVVQQHHRLPAAPIALASRLNQQLLGPPEHHQHPEVQPRRLGRPGQQMHVRVTRGAVCAIGSVVRVGQLARAGYLVRVES